MSRWSKFHEKLASGNSDNNIEFDELVSYLERLGWKNSSSGTSHRFYNHTHVPVAINVQPRSDGKAKRYQVAQIRQALELYEGDNLDGWLRGEAIP